MAKSGEGGEKSSICRDLCDTAMAPVKTFIYVVVCMILIFVVGFVGWHFVVASVRKGFWKNVNKVVETTLDPMLESVYGEESSQKTLRNGIKLDESIHKHKPSSIFMKEDKQALRQFFFGVERNINESKREYRTMSAINDMIALRLSILVKNLPGTEIFDKARGFINEYTAYHIAFQNATLQSKETLRLWIRFYKDAKQKMFRQCSSATVCEDEATYGARTYAYFRVMNGSMIDIDKSYHSYAQKYENTLVMAREMSGKQELVDIDYKKIAEGLVNGWSKKKIVLEYGKWALTFLPGAYTFGSLDPVTFGITASGLLYKALGHVYDRRKSGKELEKVKLIQGWLSLVDIMTLTHQEFLNQKLKMVSEIREHLTSTHKQVRQALEETPVIGAFNSTSIYWGFVHNIVHSINDLHDKTMDLKKNTKILYQLMQMKSEMEKMDERNPITKLEAITSGIASNPDEIIKRYMSSDDLDGDDVLDDNEILNETIRNESTTQKLPDRLHIAMEAAIGSLDT